MSGAGAGALPIWIGGFVVTGAVVAGAVWFAMSREAAAPVPTPAAVAVQEVQPGQTLESALTDPGPEPLPDADAGISAEQVAAPEPQATPPSEGAASTEAAASDQTLAAPDAPAGLPAPRLEDIRLEADGLAVIAGRALPGDTLLFRIDGAEITRTQAGADGSFAAVAFLEPSAAPRVLSLAAIGGDGTERVSPDEFIIAPMVPAVAVSEPVAEPVAEPASEAVAEAVPDAVEQPATEPVETASAESVPEDSASADAAEVSTAAAAEPMPDASAEASQIAGVAEVSASAASSEAPADAPATSAALRTDTAPEADTSLVASAPRAPEPSAPLATLPTQSDAASDVVPSVNQVAILRASPEGVEVIQPPGPPPEALTRVALDAISYSAEGDVQLSGRAERRASEVRVYLDNRPIAALKVDTSGAWRGDVPGIASGVYTLRLDAVDPAGAVQSRLETPFKREAPELLAAATASGSEAVSAITVQQGATLWAIARERYGDPLLYVQVFEANRAQIRDPDLIYPGQVFTLPDETE